MADPTSPTYSPESETTGRIKALEERAKTLNLEVKSLDGRFANRNPAALASIKAENAQLHIRFEKLQNALYSLLSERLSLGTPEENKLRTDILRTAAIEYFKKTNTDAELWKNLVS